MPFKISHRGDLYYYWDRFTSPLGLRAAIRLENGDRIELLPPLNAVESSGPFNGLVVAPEHTHLLVSDQGSFDDECRNRLRASIGERLDSLPPLAFTLKGVCVGRQPELFCYAAGATPPRIVYLQYPVTEVYISTDALIH